MRESTIQPFSGFSSKHTSKHTSKHSSEDATERSPSVSSVSANTPDGELQRAQLLAAAVPDPELPFLTVEDLGILREVLWRDGRLVVRVSPTYSGCPAVAVIEDSIKSTLQNAGFDTLVERVMAPPWTTAWITDAGRQKLLDNGIAPPVELPSDLPSDSPIDKAPVAGLKLFNESIVACPRCGSEDTELLSAFGSTPCKAQHRCKSCLEPFDHFKCL